jgi:hypothetical protein
MKKINAYDYIRLGLYIRFLRHIPSTEGNINIKEAIQELEVILNDSSFFVSINGLTRLKEFGDKLIVDIPTTSQQRSALETIMSSVEEMIRAEALSNHVYVLEQKRYNLNYLINKPEKIFPEGTYEKLPPVAKYDFDEAFKCIAYARPTAAAFHILRGTEDIIKNFLYFKKIKKNVLKKPMWGPMTDAVRVKRKSGVDPSLLDTLDYIRKTYRNPTDHPEEIYDLEKTQDLLGVCLEVINKITKIK